MWVNAQHHVLLGKCMLKQDSTTRLLCVCGFSVIQSCLTLHDPVDCSRPDSSVHGIFKARILEWVAIFSSRGISWPRHWTPISCASCTVRRTLYHWAAWEVHTWFGDQNLEQCQHPVRVRIRRSRNSYTAGGNAKFYEPLWKSLAASN